MALDSLLRKYFPLFVLALLALNAYFVASGAAELVGATLITRAASAEDARRPLVAPREEQRTADAILSRNAFDSVTGPLNAKPSAAPVPSTEPSDTVLVQRDPLRVVVCQNITTFITTESIDPRWSAATLQAADEPRPRMRRVGADVAGRRVEYIGYNPLENSPAVWLSRGETLCQALLFRPAPAPVVTAPARPQPVLPIRASPEVPPTTTSVRLAPEQLDGKTIGIRLIGIRPGSLLGTLGIRDGDVLESINGFDLGSPEKALQVYARLRTATSLNVKLTRQGQPVSIEYRIE
jgi:general secretion pathway protein C